MKNKIFLTAAFLLLATTLVFAEIPIYCPECKAHIYNYQKDEIMEGSIIKAEDFNPANDMIDQPVNGELMVCPFDGAELNGWTYWGKKQGFKSFTMAYLATSLLSKNEDGQWFWVGDDMPWINFNETTK